jgi:hypothetical protein
MIRLGPLLGSLQAARAYESLSLAFSVIQAWAREGLVDLFMNGGGCAVLAIKVRPGARPTRAEVSRCWWSICSLT